MALNTYLDREKEKERLALQPKLSAPAPVTQAGQIYQQRVTQNLLNPNPIVQQAEQQADTDISRRNYLTRKQSQEDLAQTPFSAGTQQATRLMDQSRAGANLANLQQRQGTNIFARETAERDLATAGNLEESQYAKAFGAEQTGYARERDQDQTTYTRGLAERTNEQIERGRYSSLIEDPKARYAYNRMVAAGTNPADAYKSVVGTTGSIAETYRGLSPVGTMQQDAREWVGATTSLVPGTAEFENAVRARITAVDAAKQEPLSDATELRRQETLTKDRLSTAIDTGNYSQLLPEDYTNLTPEQITKLQSAAINQTGADIKGDTWDYQAGLRNSEALKKWQSNNPGLSDANVGKPVKYGDNVYILTKPYEFTGGKDSRKIVAKGINVRTGKEETILKSSEFDTEFW